MRGTQLHRCTQTWMVSHTHIVYLLYSLLLKLIHTHTNVDMGIHSINIIAQSYLYRKAHAITQFFCNHIYSYMHAGRLTPTQIHKTSDIQPP